jgi:hypothetical protein
MKYNVERCGEYLPIRVALASHLISLTPNTTAIHLGQTNKLFLIFYFIIQYPRNNIKNNCN